MTCAVTCASAPTLPVPVWTVRDVRDSDWPALCRLGQEFYLEADLPGRFVPDLWAQNWRDWLADGLGLFHVLTADDQPAGAIGALMIPDPCDGMKVAQELFWFIGHGARGHGLPLLTALETSARAAGVRRLSMAHLSHLRAAALSHLYQRLGYAPVEVHYLKHLNPENP